MPIAVQASMSLVLISAQAGGKHIKARALGGCGDAGILEVVEEYFGNAYWVVYTVRYVDTVYVLHCHEQPLDDARAVLRRDLHEIEVRLRIVELFKRGG